MSHPPYNLCGSGNQRSAQRQYDYTNAQPESTLLGAASSFSSSTFPGTSRSIILSSTSLNYGNSGNDETIQRSADMHSSRAGEGRALSIPVQQTTQGALFLSRDSGEIGPREINEASFQMSSSSVSQGHGGTCVKNDSQSLEWLNYKRPPSESTSASLHGGEHSVPYIPGLGDDGHVVPEEPSAATSSQTTYSTETATSILRQYGLDKEDLEYLISYPEDQMTLANMQKILQQRSLEKNNRAMAASQTKTYSEPQHTTSVSGPHSHTSGFSMETGLSQKGRSATVLQQSKVIDYGHTRRYTGGGSDGDGATGDGAASSTQSIGMLPLEPCHRSRQQPQEKNKRGTNDATSSYSPMPGQNTLGPFKKLPQTSENVLGSSPLPKTEQGMKVLMSKSTKAVPGKEAEKGGQTPLKPPTSCVLLRGMHPGRPGLVLISGNKSRAAKNQQDRAPQAVKQVKQQPVEQQSKPQMPKELLLRTVTWPPGYSSGQQLPPAPNTCTISEESWTGHHSLGESLPLHQPFQTQVTNSEEQPGGKVTPLKGLPSLAMMHDYAAASPRVFPHTCSLCYKECAGMKDWIAHQNTSLHLENCKLLRQRFPDWDGTVKVGPRSADKKVKPTTTTAVEVRQKKVHRSRSRSHSASPHRHGLEVKRERRSRSRSPHSYRYALRSPEKHASSRWNDDSPRWMDERLSSPTRFSVRGSPPPRWNDDRGLAPWRDDGRLSPLRSNDRRPERTEDRPLRRRSEEIGKVKTKALADSNEGRLTSPIRSDERRLSPRRVVERRPSPRRVVERRQSPSRIVERRPSPSRIVERRPSPRRIVERRQSLSRIVERRPSPRRIVERRQSPRRVVERRLSPGRVVERRPSPRRVVERRLSPRTIESQLSTEALSHLEASGVKSKHPDLNVMVKNLASALVAEIKKITPNSLSPSPSSSSSKGGKQSPFSFSASSSPSVVKKSSLCHFKSKLFSQKGGEGPSKRIEVGKSGPPTMVKLEGITNSLSHNDIYTAVEKFGKTKSVVLFRSKQQAIVCFEKEEDAKKLKKVKSINVKSVAITVADKSVATVQKLPPHNKSCMFIASTSKTAKPAASSASRKVPVDAHHKGPSVSGASKVTTICKTKATSSKVCGKGLKTTIKSKSLVSKSKTNASVLAGKKIKGKVAVAGVVKKVLKKKVPIKSKTASQTGGSKVKPKPVKSDTMDNKSAVEEMESIETIVTEPVSDANEASEKLAIAGGNMEESVPLECIDAENHPQTGDFKLKPKPVTSETVNNKSTVPEEERGSVHKSVKTTSAESAPVADTDPDKEGNMEESLPLECTDAENQPRTGGAKLKPKPGTSHIVDNKCTMEVGGEKLTTSGNIQEEGMPADAQNQPEADQNKNTPVLGTCVSIKETVKVEKLTVFNPDFQPDTVKCIKTEDGEPMQLSKTQSTQLQEVNSGILLKREKSPPLDISTDEPSRKPVFPPLEMPPPGSPNKSSHHAEPNLPGAAQSTAETPEIKTKALDVEQSEDRQKTKPEGAVLLLKTHDRTSSAQTVVAVKKEQQLPKCKLFQSDVLPLTVGETIANFIKPDQIINFKYATCKSMFPSSNERLKIIQITGLPSYDECCYTEEELAEVLRPFGFRYTPSVIFVLPQAQMAFALIPTIYLGQSAQKITFKQWRLHIRVMPGQNFLTPISLYKSLMSMTKFPVKDDDSRTIYLKNISPSDARDLCSLWKKHSHVVNFLPLLNKAFIQFSSTVDADRFGVWHSLKKFSGHEIYRQKAPSVCLPWTDFKGATGHEDVVDGVTIPPVNLAPPKGSGPPFWITRKTSTLFPTACPWFSIPDYLTVSKKEDIEAASSRGSTFSTVMLTNLPLERYSHEDIAQFVWPYFTQHTFKTLCYNIIVLPLQKRAFVIFENWNACCHFVQDHIKKTVFFSNSIHIVFQRLISEYTQEALYTSLIKLSEAGTFSEMPRKESLKQRLLCLETSHTSLHIIGVAMEKLASCAAFVRYVPLANRIYVEMANSSDVQQVLKKFQHFQCKHYKRHLCATGIIKPETLESFEKRLEDIGNSPVILGQGAVNVSPQSDQGGLKTIKVTIHQHLHTKQTLRNEQEKRDDFTSDSLASNAIIFDEVPPSSSWRPLYQSSGKNQSTNKSKLVAQNTTGSCHNSKSASGSPKASVDFKSKISAKSSSSSSQRQCEGKSPANETNTASSDCSLRASAEPQVKRPQEKPVGGAVESSDHREAADSTEAERKPQTEKECEDEENYQILDSFEAQTDEKMDDEDQQGSSFTQLIEPGASMDDEGKTCPEENVNMSVDVSVPEDPAPPTRQDVQPCGEMALEKHSSSTNLCKGVSSESLHNWLDDAGETTVDLDQNAANIVACFDKDILKTIKVTIHQHTPTGEAQRDEEEEKVESIFDEQDFSMEDFVTVDEVGADVEDTASEPQSPSLSSSSSKPIAATSSKDSKSCILEDQAALSLENMEEQDKVSQSQNKEVKGQPVVVDSENDEVKTTRKRTPSRRSGESSQKMDLTSTISIGESATKQGMRKKYETRSKAATSAGVSKNDKKLKEAAEEVVLEDGAQDGKPGRRRSTRGKKDDKLSLNLTETAGTPLIHAVTAYKVLDSPAEETPDDEAKVTTSARGKRGSSTKKAALNAPARKRATEELSETQLPDQERATNISEVTGEECEEDATYKILDSVGDEVLEESPAPTRQRKRGRPKKTAKARKGKQPLKDDAAEKVTEGEEEEVYQVIDSVEEDAADDQLVAGLPEGPGRETTSKTGDEQIADGSSVPGSTRNQEEEEPEPLYQMVGSLTTEAVSAASKDNSKCTAAAQASTGVPNVPRADETVSDLEVREDSAAAEGSGTSSNQSPSKMESGQEDKPETESQNEPPNPEEAPLDKLVNLDEVSEEEENYPDDTAEEEEPRTRQAGSKKKQEAKTSERLRTQRSRRSNDRGGDRSRRIPEKERGKQNEHSVEEDTKELLTLDEVGADEPEEERAAESRDKDEIGETEPQSLITLDEVGDEAEDKVVENNSPRTHPLSEEDQSVDFLNPETLVTLDEAGEEEPEEDHRQKHAGKRKTDTETDEVGEEEEEKIPPRTRGRPRKRTKKTPVRRSVRGKNTTTIDAAEKEAEEEEAASVAPPTSLEKAESVLSTDGQEELQRSEVKSGSAEQQSGDQTQEERLDEDKSREDVKAVSKRRTKLAGPEAKRVCKQSTGVSTAFDFPVSKPKSPVGQEFVVPVSGYFCHLCSLFYRNESTAMELHCSSQKHYDNLQKHCEKIKQKQSGSTTEKSRGHPASE